MRVTKPRKDFADDSFSFTEKDAGDTTNDLK
jgi:dynein intermediate chain 3, axonemal